MPARYHFRGWAREVIGSERPAVVQRWFGERGLELTAEAWRKYLRPSPPPTLVLDVWKRICDVTQQPLSRFFEYTPGDRPTPSRRPRKPGRVTTTAPQREPESRHQPAAR